MKRIALFVHCFFPWHFYGTEVYTYDLARNFKELGYDPVVVSAIPPGDEPASELVTTYEWEGVPVYCVDRNKLPPQSIADTYYQQNLKKTLRAILTDISPDLVHVTHLTNHTVALLEVAADLKLPVVATFTDFFGFCYNFKLETASGQLCAGPNASRSNCIACMIKMHAPYQKRFRKFAARPRLNALYARLLRINHAFRFARSRIMPMVQGIVERPDVLAKSYATYRGAIAPTTFLRDAYLRNGTHVPLRVMHFGIDGPRTPKPVRSPEQPLQFGFIGQLEPHKGLDLLVDAFVSLPAGQAQLQIYGTGDEGSDYLQQVRRTARQSDIRFLGTFPKNRMAEILDGIDFLVIPSRWYENSPLVLLSALASHTPVIVADVAGMTEFVQHGINGFVVERGSRAALAQMLAYIVVNRESALAMVATTNYERTTRQMALDVLDFYREAGIDLEPDVAVTT